MFYIFEYFLIFILNKYVNLFYNICECMTYTKKCMILFINRHIIIAFTGKKNNKISNILI